MFQKNTFGASTSFGGFNASGATSSPFGGFKPAGTASAFGATPTFGAGAPTQPATGGGLFGSPANTGGLFGAGTSAATAAPAFGAPTAAGGFGFGQTSTAGGGLFGSTGAAGGGLFGQTQQQSTNAFGAKPAGFGFSNASTAGTTGGGLFGTPAGGGGLFGQQNTTMGGGGLFGNTAGGFGQPQQQPNSGTALVKFSPVMGTDSIMKSGQSTNITIKHHCITCMKEYENKSLEELRLEDYTAGRRGGAGAGGGMFGGASSAFQPPAGDNKPAGGLFGVQTSAFGQPTTTSSGGVFGAGGGMTGGFGQPSGGTRPRGTTTPISESSTSAGLLGDDALHTAPSISRASPDTSFSFGGATQSSSAAPLFGAGKPAFGAPSTSGGLFGSTTQQAAPAFGASNNTFGFGSAASQPQASNMFGAKPSTTGFGTAVAPAASGFGAFGTANTSGGLFGKPLTTSAAPAFGAPTPAFGSLSGGFGTTTSTAGGIFGAGNTGLGAKPAQPFGFGSTQPQAGGLGGLGALGSNTFNQPKLGAGGTMFPSFAPGNTFSTAAQPSTQPLGGFGTSSLGGGLGGFGTLGSNTLGNTSFSGLGSFNSGAGNALAPGLPGGAPAAGNVHEQILSLASRPYGDSPLFKGLTPNTGATSEDVLKPTNPAAMKAAMENSAYKVSPPDVNRLKVLPLGPAPARNKKSLFDGLEESDATLEERLSLKPSRKRLVLRPQQNWQAAPQRSSMEMPSQVESPSGRQVTSPDVFARDAERRPDAGAYAYQPDVAEKSAASFEAEVRGVNTDLEEDTERRASWLGSRISTGSPKAKAAPDSEGSPRLYPNLEKEMSSPDRRASWLTSKPLHKRTSYGAAAAAESSVRELRAQPELQRAALLDSDDKENQDSVRDADRSVQGFCAHRAGTADRSRCEKIAHQIKGIYVSEEESVSAVESYSPHPTGIKLTRPGYYTVPSLDDLIGHMRADGSCVVPHFTIGRRNYGNVYYDCEINVAGLDLDKLVHFMNKEVVVYPDECEKPPVGEGLNRRAIVTLDGVWPRDKTARRPITEPERLLKMEYEGRLRRVCDKHDTKFIEYRPETGSWVFRVEHFSKYGLTDSDEEEEMPPDVLKRQLKPQPPAPAKPPAPLGLGGPMSNVLGGPMSGLAGPPVTVSLVGSSPPAGMGGPMVPAPSLSIHEDSMSHQFNGTTKGLAMDTSEENSNESQSLYTETSRVYGVKSPTGELARLDRRSSHRVQLMKASLYSDTVMQDVEDDVSASTGDQLVPQPGSPTSAEQRVEHPESGLTSEPSALLPRAQEVAMRPLLVKPHTVVLRYHRRVPPFLHTVAGRLGAASIADMSVCRARHSRVGFAPGGRLALVTTHHRVSTLPRSAELSCLGEYVAGRGPEDWSARAVARLAVAGRDAAVRPHQFNESMEAHLLALLEHSERTPAPAGGCPRLLVQTSPESRLKLLRLHVKQAQRASEEKLHADTFGAAPGYWLSVWTLCEALWGCDLENGGLAGNSDAQLLARQRALLAWLDAAVADATERELARPVASDPLDESDRHSPRVLSLLLGGRRLEACRVARDNGDLNMAVLLAQASGDACVRTLLERQVSLWRECGALPLVSRARLAALMLCAGVRSVRCGSDSVDLCGELDWLRAFNVHARYLCHQVCSVEEAVRSYEAMFRPRRAEGAPADEERPELTTLADEPDGPELPLPPYSRQYELTIENDGKTRRILDLRYELLKSRAYDTRPNVQPASYTPDSLDYSLSFLVGAWLGNLSVPAIAGVAEQLEASGAWHLAVLALMYHPHEDARAALVRGVVSRHAPALAVSPDALARLAFLRQLELPERWIRLAQAHRAKYERLPAVEAEHLAAAGEWGAAHRVLLDELLPEAVLADKLEELTPLIGQLQAARERSELSGWESGGQALYHYVHVCAEIRGLVSESGGASASSRASLNARLEAMRPRVALACRALGGLPCGASARHKAARAEMGQRLVQLAACAGADGAQLAALLRALRLPPDNHQLILHKITTELAEQASESCAASAEGSPVSSRARPLTAAPDA